MRTGPARPGAARAAAARRRRPARASSQPDYGRVAEGPIGVKRLVPGGGPPPPFCYTDLVLIRDRLRIHEIYRSIQGESASAGLPCTFVRLTGCDLRCRWCDTEHAFDEGSWMSTGEVVERVAGLGDDLVLVTGGEPLLQQPVHALLAALLERGAQVQLETGGHRPLEAVDPRVQIIMDIKCPGSGESARNHLANLARLGSGDEAKLVLVDERDYRWARALIAEHRLAERCQVILSPVHGELDPAELAAWIIRDRLPVRLGIQLHKIIWTPECRGV